MVTMVSSISSAIRATYPQAAGTVVPMQKVATKWVKSPS
jgi:hypothetical protein